MSKYTLNEWGRCENALETSGEDVKIHSFGVEKIKIFEWRRCHLELFLARLWINVLNVVHLHGVVLFQFLNLSTG